MPQPTIAFLSFRLGGSDGVAVEAAKWARVLAARGFAVYTVAGAGTPDVLLDGLAMHAASPPADAALAGALASADLVVVENLLSLPLNPRAARSVARALRGRAAVLHHHDLSWQRAVFADAPPPPTDPAWRHVTINRHSAAELRSRGIAATYIYNAFDTTERPGRREQTRTALCVAPDELLVLQPTRAIERKNVAGGIDLAERLGATYWLTGPAEDGYESELARILGSARCRVLRGHPAGAAAEGPDTSSMASAYAACDVVVLPSTWEGFGNPAVESAIHHRPLAVGAYPVALELASFGFRWFALHDTAGLAAWLGARDDALLDHNAGIAHTHFSLDRLGRELSALVADLLGSPNSSRNAI